MKKIATVLIAAMLAVVMLVGCGSKTASPAASEEKSKAYTAGTYEGEAQGKNGVVKVAVTVDDNSITEVKVTDHSETAGIGDAPIEQIPKEIVEGQTLKVDAVTGATITSNAILAAVEDALTKAGADIEALKAAEAAAKETKTIEKTADVIIVGGGGAGLAAAVSATDGGASVIVVEKTAILGGNTLVCGGIYNCPDPKLQDPEGIEDSVELFATQTWEAGDKLANKELVDILCGNAYDGLKWLEGLGVEFTGKITQGPGSLYPRTHEAVKTHGTGFIDAYKTNLESKGDLYEAVMNTSAKSFIMENGKVVGVNAVDSDGNTVIFHANKDVILATGGFAGNVELREKYCEGEKWPDLGESLLTTNMAGVTGDGIIMAEEIGASLIDMEQIQLLHMTSPKNGSTDGNTIKCKSVDSVIFVNQEGNRFVREDGRRDEISKATLEQTDSFMYVVESSDGNTGSFEEMQVHDGRTYREAEADGDIFIADTLEELCEKTGMNVDNLKKSLDGYNASVREKATSDEFGRTVFVNEILNGPFVATPRVPSAHHTMGGVEIDSECHVLDTNGKIIEGLLAAGEVTGGIHGTNRVGGNAVVDTVVFGKIAGETASK